MRHQKFTTKQIHKIQIATTGLFFLIANPVIAASSDGRGHIWTPDGTYTSKYKSVEAKLSTKGDKNTLSAGNGCIVEGKLSQKKKGDPTYILTVEGRDGIACPYVKEFTITVIDGPAIRAEGNAEKLKISHPHQDGSMDFSGIYTFENGFSGVYKLKPGK